MIWGCCFRCLLLVGMGIVMVYSASSALALQRNSAATTTFLKRQALFSLAGILALVGFSYIPFSSVPGH